MSAFSDLYTKELEKDLNWREIELAILKRHLQQASVGSVQEKALLRANLAMVYAHYEGFCKFALGIYVQALNKRKLKRKFLKWPIALHSLNDFFLELKAESRPDKFFDKFFEEFEVKLEEIGNLDNIAETSNLWPDLLIGWLQRLDLPTKNISDQEQYLKELVNSRNKIAHGEILHIKDKEVFAKYANAANLAMHEVAIEIAESLEKKAYQRHNIVHSIFAHAPNVGRN